MVKVGTLRFAHLQNLKSHFRRPTDTRPLWCRHNRSVEQDGMRDDRIDQRIIFELGISKPKLAIDRFLLRNIPF
jgi:hypothetical protein